MTFAAKGFLALGSFDPNTSFYGNVWDTAASPPGYTGYAGCDLNSDGTSTKIGSGSVASWYNGTPPSTLYVKFHIVSDTGMVWDNPAAFDTYYAISSYVRLKGHSSVDRIASVAVYIAEDASGTNETLIGNVSIETGYTP